MTVDAQLASPVVPVLFLAELQFASGTLRLTSWNHNLDWAGHTWTGLGALVTVSAVKASERNEYPALDLGLQVGNDALLALALGNATDYRRRAALLYQCVLDDQLRPLGDPELVWGGQMSQVRVNTGNGEDAPGLVTLRCELPGRDRRGARTLRLNNAQQQERHPGDTFLSRIEAMAGKPQPWLSVRFQKV